jgi:hypothetical protein
MYISKPLRWKHLELSREENKKSTRKKMPKIRLFLSIICHRYFDTNHFITWFVYFLVCFGENQLIPLRVGKKFWNVNISRIFLKMFISPKTRFIFTLRESGIKFTRKTNNIKKTILTYFANFLNLV